MASYLDTINRLYDLERKRINPYSAAEQEVGAQQLSVVPQLQTSVETQAAASDEEKNKGGVIGGVGYVGEKFAAGLVQSIEGIWDFAAGGLADLFGADDWAEDQVANSWFGDWYETAGDWFNASDGWKVAGDVASGIGTSVLPMAAMFIPVPYLNYAVSFSAASMAAGGTALKEAYAKTGKLGTKEWSYAAMSGATEGGLEVATNIVGWGGGTLLKQFGKTAAKNMAKQATKAATKQGVKATLSTIGKTAFEGFIGEAFEEGMSTILNPIYARASYDPEAQNATAQEIAYSALVGGLSGIVMGEGGLAASSIRSTALGGKLVNQSEAILAEAEAIIKDEEAEPSGSNTVKLINAKKAQLEKSVQDNNGVYDTTQKKLLGDLNLAVTEHVATKAAQASAVNIINNAEAIAQELNTLGYKDVNGNPMNVTAEMIREGVSGKNKRNALRNALKNNPLLRSLAAADAAGRLLMDTNSFAEQARSGKTFRTQDLLDQFIERASDAQKASLGRDLGISNWDGLRVEEFNYLVENQPDTVGKQFKRARQAQQFEKLRNTKSFTIGKASAYRANKDGIRKYKVNGHTFAVEKNGDEYTLYDYDNKGVSIELSLDELRKSLAIYDEAQAKLKQSAGKTADASEQGAEQNKASTAEKSSENAQKEKTATENDTGKGENLVQKSFKLAKKVAGYDKLSAPDQRRVRSFIRQGLAFGVKEDVIIAGASISSRTRVEAIFNKAACAIIDENGNLTGYANGLYNPRTKQFVFNPEAQSTDGILIHELDHAIRKRVGKGGFVTTKIYKGAIEKLNPDTFKKITEKYDKKHEQRGKVPETVTYLKRTSEQKLADKLVEQKKQEEFAKTAETLIDEYEAHYAQQVLENKGIMEHLVAEKPALKQRILDFFKGAEVDYAKVPALSKEAAKYYKRYKRWFDSFAKSREGARIGAEAEMGVRGGESDVRYSLPKAFQTLGKYDETRIRHIESSGKDHVVRDYGEILEFIRRSKAPRPFERLHIGIISDKTAALVKAKTGEDIRNYDFVLASNFVFHIYDSHGNEATEAPRGQKAVSDSNIENILEAVIDPDDVSLVSDSTGTALRFEKILEGRNVAITITSTKKSTLTLKSAWIINEKSGGRTPSANANALAGTPEANSRSSTTNSIAETAEKSNPSGEKTSVNAKDSLGNELTEAQAEYFKDSKVRDKDGNLLVCTHFSPSKFTVFDKGYIGEGLALGRGFYFFDTVLNNAPREYGDNQYKCYLNLKNPAIITLRWEDFSSVLEKIGISENEYGHLKSDRPIYDVADLFIDLGIDNDEISDVLRKAGYDGIWVKNANVVVAFESNQIKLTSNKAPTTNPDIRMSLPLTDADGNTIEYSEEDLEYERAVQDALMHGDMREVQDMVDEAAKEAGYTVKGYHGSHNSFTVFDEGKSGLYGGIESKIGFWFGATRKGAENWVSETWGTDENNPQVYESWLKIENPKVFTTTEMDSEAIEKVDEEIADAEEKYKSLYEELNELSFLARWSVSDYIRTNGKTVPENSQNLDEKTFSKAKKIADELVSCGVMIESLRAKRGELIFTDSYEQFKTEIYKLAGKTAEDANVGGLGRRLENGADVVKKYKESLVSQGYDGIIIKDTRFDADTIGEGKNSVQIVAFRSSQIKSADPVTFDDDGYIIPISKRFDIYQNDIRRSLPLTDENGDVIEYSAEDRAYEKAVRINDMKTAQRMVDEKARKAGYTQRAFHGTRASNFYIFDENRIGDNYGGYNAEGGAFDFTYDESRAWLWAEKAKGFGKPRVIEAYIKAEKPFYSYDGEVAKELFDLLPSDISEEEKQYAMAHGVAFKEVLENHGIDFKKAVMSKGIDSYKMYRGDFGNIGVYSPFQIKSTAPVTYDDNGFIIPLSKRFDPTVSDIRFSMDLGGTSPLDDSYVDNGVPYIGGNEMSVGEMRKRIANSTHYKVYSKSRMLETVKKLPVAGFLKGKTLETLADSMWTSFNAITSAEQAGAYMSDMADYIMSVAMREAKTGRTPSEDAQRRFTMMSGYVQKLVFSKEQLYEIKTVLGEKEYKRILGRWGYKAKAGETSHRVPMDFFVTDIAREMSEFSYLEDMNPIDAFFALDEAYTEAKKDVDDKWQSIFEDVSDAELDAMRYALKEELWNAYKTAGDKSNYKRILENTVDRYKDRANYWKAEYDKANRMTHLTNIVRHKALKLKDLKTHRFAGATQIENDTLDSVIGKLSSVFINGNLSVKKVRSACAQLSILYNSDGFRENVLEWRRDERGQWSDTDHGQYNSLISDYLMVLAGESDLTFDEYVEHGYYKGLGSGELRMLADVMSYFTSLYENYGKVWRQGKLLEAMPLAKQYIAGIQETKAIYGERIGNRLTNWYRDTFFDPISVMRRIDGYAEDGFHTEIYGELRRGIIDASVAIMDIFREYDGWLNSHKKYLANASETTVEFMGNKIPKIKLIDLYCTTKRKHAQAGLAINGFKYDDLKGLAVRVDGKLDKDGKYTDEQIQEVITDMQTEIEKHLTSEDREYIAQIEKVYNGEAKRLKTMRDFVRQGFTNASEGYYYPIRRAYDAVNVDSSSMKAEIDRVSNASFNKDIVKGAKGEITVESADSRFRRHVQAVCQYAYLSPAIDTFNRLYNLDTVGNKGRPVSIRTESENLWRNGMMYFKKLVADIQGINERTEGSEVLSFLRGGYAISVLSLNPKVWVTQLSSFAAASGMLDMDCITSGITTAKKEDIKNIGRYCPLAELRRYENTAAMAQAVIDPRGAQRNKGGKVMQAVRKAGEVGMAPIEKMDSLVINRLFGACMKQVAKNQGLKVGTEENKIAAGKLLETLILETQQNALATERSAAMRSNNEFFRAGTMFSADAMKVVCRFADATGEARALKARIKNATDPDVKASLEAKLKQANKKVRKTLGALLASSAYMAAVTAAFKTLYKKWDKEWEEDEAKAHSVGVSILFDFLGNNFGGLPFIRDVVSKLTEGYDIDNYAYSAINDIVNAAQKIATLASGDATDADVANALRDLAYATSNLTGLPVRNVYNIIYGLTKRVSEPAAYKIDEVFYNKNYASDLNKYLDEGDTKMVDFMVDLIYGTRTDTTLKESTMKELRNLANKDYKVLPREIKGTVTIDGNEYKLTATEQEKVREKYTEYLSALDRLTESASYSKLDTEQKYDAVKYVIDTYYNKAVSDVLGNDCGKATLLSACIGGEKMAVLKAVVKDYENDTDKKGEDIAGTKRKKIVKAINATSATTTQKILMMYALGYTPKDKEIAGVSSDAAKKQLLNAIVNAKALTKAQKESLAKACGFTVKNGKITP